MLAPNLAAGTSWPDWTQIFTSANETPTNMQCGRVSKQVLTASSRWECAVPGRFSFTQIKRRGTFLSISVQSVLAILCSLYRRPPRHLSNLQVCIRMTPECTSVGFRSPPIKITGRSSSSVPQLNSRSNNTSEPTICGNRMLGTKRGSRSSARSLGYPKSQCIPF
jgi:hypothetical protein